MIDVKISMASNGKNLTLKNFLKMKIPMLTII